MNIKKTIAMGVCLLLLTGLLTTPVLALDSGAYTASVVTSYYNPDTGNVDDGGTSNAALGEGMCRSATDTTALVEVDGDDIWITIRLLLQSNCKNVTFYTRTDYDNYAKVNYTVTAEDSANDSVDFRFKASDPGVKLKCTMYVTPMGRDVLWYLYLDTSTLTAGSGDFVVNIETSPEESAANSAASITESAANPVASITESTGNETGTSEETKTEAEAARDQKDDGLKKNNDETKGDTPETEKTDTVPPEQISEDQESESAGDRESVEPAEQGQESAAFSDEVDSAQSGSGGMLAGIIAVIIVAVGVIVVVMRRRRNV